MSDARKNSLLLTAILVALASLPMTWFHASGVSAELPAGMNEAFGGKLTGMSFEVTGFQGNIALLGGLPFWAAIGIVVVASVAQLVARLPEFDIPVAALWILGIAGFVTVAIPVLAGFSSDATVYPRMGWFLALLASIIPLSMLALPSQNTKKGANEPMQPSGEVGRFEVDD